MYYPYLRGKQYELIAVRELIEKKLISKNVVPIIEPIKETATLRSTLETGIENNHQIYTIINPQVGEYSLYEENHPITGEVLDLNYDAILMNNAKDVSKNAHLLSKSEKFIAIYSSRDDLKNFAMLKEKSLVPSINFVKDGHRFSRFFRQEHQEIGLIRDAFDKQKRNVDYADESDKFFSDDHLYYRDEGYVAFSDYSIVGDHYLDNGFAPVAVAIHIVYFDSNDVLRIKHFVSESNDDNSDPAGKFREALEKLINWAKTTTALNHSDALKQFQVLWNEKRYPGLGFTKKLSIMHHLEIMDNYLSRR
ncbi:sce7725 family protein [Staphylococcus pseudintermedius]|nr:sce7725 family protein [Staphylococcus pseudintermedius]HAR6088925.1 sce7725 family protein [Staphylococcus pseudintermedius]